MSSTVRQNKYAKLMQKELSDLFLLDKRGIFNHTFVTVSEVRMSPDLSIAKVYLSMLLAKNPQHIMEQIELHKSEIRKALGNSIRHQARIVPQLYFFHDQLEEKAQQMDALIGSLGIPKAE